MEADESHNPSQLWIRMQFAPELEEPQAFNWFAELLVLVVLVLVVVNEKNWKPFEVKSYLAFGKPEAGPAGRSLVLNLLQTKQKQLSILSLPSSLMQESVYLCCPLKKTRFGSDQGRNIHWPAVGP